MSETQFFCECGGCRLWGEFPTQRRGGCLAAFPAFPAFPWFSLLLSGGARASSTKWLSTTTWRIRVMNTHCLFKSLCVGVCEWVWVCVWVWGGGAGKLTSPQRHFKYLKFHTFFSSSPDSPPHFICLPCLKRKSCRNLTWATFFQAFHWFSSWRGNR